jgi:hypothetical protein
MTVFGQQDPPVAEALQNPRHHHAQAHGVQRLRHDQQAGLDRAVAKPDLIEQGEQEWHSAHADARDEAADDRGFVARPVVGEVGAPAPAPAEMVALDRLWITAAAGAAWRF